VGGFTVAEPERKKPQVSTDGDTNQINHRVTEAAERKTGREKSSDED
jgi:hypothetical protein